MLLIAGTDFFVSGLQENYPTSNIKGTDIQVGEVVPIVSFHNCSQIITKYVESKAKPPEELPLKTIFTFSYYFDRAIEVGLIGKCFCITVLIFLMQSRHSVL